MSNKSLIEEDAIQYSIITSNDVSHSSLNQQRVARLRFRGRPEQTLVMCRRQSFEIRQVRYCTTIASVRWKFELIWPTRTVLGESMR